jgi:alkanesulfonate monooxygenase SsuD/methylene tetrahydromethanopterin reductase-like flavin-dependent oxidoreductase (luciferase family)
LCSGLLRFITVSRRNNARLSIVGVVSDVIDPAPRRGLSIFLQTPPAGDPARSYEDAIEVIELAERTGYEIAWIAEAHFAPIGLPAALTLLAAAAQRARSIRLGTAVIPLVFDHPIRLAETAAVADYLSGGRLEFGVGKSNGGGFSTAAFEAFRLAEEDREALYDVTLVQLREALAGTIAGEDRPLPVYPSPRPLLSRVWQATATPANAAAIGAAGDGMLLHRLAFDGETGPVQSALIDSFLGAYSGERAPRIGVSRAVLPAESRSDALALIAADYERDPAAYAGFGATSPEDFLRRSNVAYGTTDEIAERLQEDAAVARSTDYLFTIPLPNGSPEFRAGVRAIAEEIYPRLPLSIGV